MVNIKKRFIFNLLVITISVFIPFTVCNAAFRTNNKRYKVDVEIGKAVDIADVVDLIISAKGTIVSDVEILSEDRDDIKIEVKGTVESFPKIKQPSVEIKKDENEKEINIVIKSNNEDTVFETMNSSVKCKIYIPDDYDNNININNSNGNTTISNIKLNTYSLEFKYGNAKLLKVNAKKMNVNGSYGNVFIEGCEGNISCTNNSGNIKLVINKLTSDIYAKMVYGDIICEIEENVEANIESCATYGTIKNKISHNDNEFYVSKNGCFLNKKFGDEDNTIKLDTYSGTISLSKFSKNDK